MPDQGGEKTEQASPKKREDERKKGNVFMSKDVTTVVTLLVSFYAVKAFIMSFLGQIQAVYEHQMQRVVSLAEIGAKDIIEIFFECARVIATTVLPVMLIIGLVTFLSVGAQTRFLISRELIKFKFDRLDPIKGISKLFSMRSLVELFKNLIKIAIIITILYNNVRKTIYIIPSVMDYDIMQAAAYTGNEIMSLLISVGIAFTAVAGLDYLYQRWEYEKNIRMTKQEVKDEYKQMEGNPEVKGARRQKQREFAQQRMMQQVKEADVVVRNPTHYAVALRYRLDEDAAPVVLAKGVDHLALRIVEEAEKHGVMAVENPPLARGLYAAADIDGIIPLEFFQPVAEVLAWVFTARKEAATAGKTLAEAAR